MEDMAGCVLHPRSGTSILLLCHGRAGRHRMTVVWRVNTRFTRMPVHAMSRDSSTGWKTKNMGKNALFVLDYTLYRVIPMVEGDIIAVVDNNSGYKKQAKDLIESKLDHKRVVIGDQYSSSRDEYSPQLRTHDYVANALRSDIESGDKRRTLELGYEDLHCRGYGRVCLEGLQQKGMTDSGISRSQIRSDLGHGG